MLVWYYVKYAKMRVVADWYSIVDFIHILEFKRQPKPVFSHITHSVKIAIFIVYFHDCKVDDKNTKYFINFWKSKKSRDFLPYFRNRKLDFLRVLQLQKVITLVVFKVPLEKNHLTSDSLDELIKCRPVFKWWRKDWSNTFKEKETEN